MVGVIAESLAGKRIAITGSTGFVGTALVERLLRSVPGCQLVLLVRDGKRTPAARRVQRELLKNDAFDRLRRDLGSAEFDEMAAERITTIAGDVGTDGLGLTEADRAVLASCDVVIHSAAAVSFDSPLDSAVEINLLGPTRIATLLNELQVAPHLVAVSTCYVAGNRRGTAPEELVSAGPFDLGLSWRAEVDAARRLRGDAEAASRSPEQLAEFRKEARTELGAAGAPALAAKTEQRREQWVRDRLVEAGRARAASVGWPDAYAFTKALGEQALTDSKGAVPVSIVRPSIIESALAEPRPGWIRGFRMAEPVLISYARGLLREFPGVPEGTVDVIPVDLVVAAIITRGRARTIRGAGDLPGRLGGHQPAEVPRARGQRQRLVHRAPDLRLRRPADRRARVPLPWAGAGAGAAPPCQVGDHTRGADAPGVAVARQAGRAVGQAGEQAGGGRAGPRVRGAVRPVHGM